MSDKVSYTYLITGIFYESSDPLLLSHDITTEHGPFDALLRFTSLECGESRGNAAKMLESDSFDAVVWRYNKKTPPERVAWQDIEFPWRVIDQLKNKISQLDKALETYATLDVLRQVPGFDTQLLDNQLEPALAYRDALKKQLNDTEHDWNNLKTSVVSKELRNVNLNDS